jgi:hypothetical protein
MGQDLGLASIAEARARACVSIYSRTFVSLPFRTVMSKTQSDRPNTREKVNSSVPLGSGELPGCVCNHSRPKVSGRRPASTWSSKKLATASSSNPTWTQVQVWATSCTSSTNNKLSGAEIPNAPISVSPASRRNKSFAHAVGLNRNTVGRRITGSVFIFRFVCMARSAPFLVIETARANMPVTSLARF